LRANQEDEEEEGDEYTTVYSSCNEVEVDGLYYIKPLPDLPVLPVICSNGYAMLDASLDINLNVYPSYLSSWDYGRLNTDYILSRLDDLSTFREWFLPADENTQFYVAPGCTECVAGDYDDNTVYYIDSHTFCFSGAVINGCIDDTESSSYHAESCNTCDAGIWPSNDQTQPWLKCTALQLSADHVIDHEHITCVAHGLTFHPSLSTVRDACTCYRPVESDGVLAYSVAVSELPLVSSSEHEITRYGLAVADNIRFDASWSKEGETDDDDVDGSVDARESNVVYLYQSDFEDGTYRIRESGTYVVMEDIVFNFNAPSAEQMESDSFSPNSVDVDELYWFPTRQQAARDGEYAGLYDYIGAFTLGFFAGITVECDYVTIDLNGFTLSQHAHFYLQQRFFALIELASQPFVPGQGPANWGAGNDVYAQYVEIKNGNLGLSSHHSIHGNNNQFVTISNVQAAHFDVAGIQCNACSNVEITDCVVGPQNDNIPVLGRYTHCRAYLPRLKELQDLYGEEEIVFYGREPVTVQTLIDRLVTQMDLIYFHVIDGVQYDEQAEQEEEWTAAKKLLLNPTGWMDGGSSYGMLFGGAGAQVVGIGARHDDTADITISNVEIFGIYNAVLEKVKFTADFGATRLIFFDAMDWMAVEDQVDDVSSSNYVGDAYTDITFAISRVVESWYFQNSLYVSPEMSAHVFEGDHAAFVSIFKQPNPDTDKGSQIIGGCGTDIQLHSSKGAIGLRVDGTQNMAVDNLFIHDIYNAADLGSQTWCGQYPGPDVGNEDIDIQYGYTGTRAHGLVLDYVSGSFSNVNVENVESYYGEANAVTIYKQCTLDLANIRVDAIHAGTKFAADPLLLDALQLPNLVPRACGVDIRFADDGQDGIVLNVDADVGLITGDDITGPQTCYADNDDEEDGENMMQSILSMNISQLMLMLLLSLSILLYLGKIIAEQIQSTKETQNHQTKCDEHTPLL